MWPLSVLIELFHKQSLEHDAAAVFCRVLTSQLVHYKRVFFDEFEEQFFKVVNNKKTDLSSVLSARYQRTVTILHIPPEIVDSLFWVRVCHLDALARSHVTGTPGEYYVHFQTIEDVAAFLEGPALLAGFLPEKNRAALLAPTALISQGPPRHTQ
jgi:hypothetical protein